MNDYKQLIKKLFPYAYNILGNTADAQDVIQDVLIKFNEKESASISNQNAYLIKSVINQSINLKKKNDRNRQLRISLPEPIITNYGENKIELEEILNYSMLVLLDTLNTRERAVFLLKEAFNYEHDELSEILDISVENSRQLLTRAKKKLKSRKPVIATLTTKDKKFLDEYVEAIRNGDVSTLEKILSKEVQILADGGNKLNVVAQLTSGLDEAIKLITYIFAYYQKDFEIKVEEINHQPALLFYEGETLINCQVFELNSNGKIENIFSVVDPDKLINI